MKNIFRIKSIIVLALVAIFISACMDETENLFSGEFVEWEGAIAGSSGVYLRTDDGLAIRDTFRINLVAAQKSTPTVVQVAVIDSATTAVEGVQYRLISGSEITIPANESFGYVIFEVLDDNINPGEIWTLGIGIVGGDVQPSENYKLVEHNFQVACPSDIPVGTYLETGEDGFEVELTRIDDDTYQLSQMNFRYYDPTYEDVPGVFTDVCNALTLEGEPIPEAFDIAWVGSGTFDPATNTLSFSVADATYNPDISVDMEFVLQ
ncbi:MAG: hypothetical protein AAF693_18435 [Bacteroidota bacterium]